MSHFSRLLQNSNFHRIQTQKIRVFKYHRARPTTRAAKCASICMINLYFTDSSSSTTLIIASSPSSAFWVEMAPRRSIWDDISRVRKLYTNPHLALLTNNFESWCSNTTFTLNYLPSFLISEFIRLKSHNEMNGSASSSLTFLPYYLETRTPRTFSSLLLSWQSIP